MLAEPPPEPDRNPLHIADGPRSWRLAAAPSDILSVPGHRLSYWGNPDAKYGRRATRLKAKPRAVIVHFTYPHARQTTAQRTMNLVRYQHNGDPRRGGAYGYTIYVSKSGQVVQGAPLSVRTNHIKPFGHSKRRKGAPRVSSSDSIGVGLVGSCDRRVYPVRGKPWACGREHIPALQRRAALAVVRAVQTRFGIPCTEVYGHGDMQTDRQSIEGKTISRLRRAECKSELQPVYALGR